MRGHRPASEQNHITESLDKAACTIPLSKTIAIRISSDASPHNLLTADLQKGLRLVYRGREVVGEGTGFGVPVLLYSNDTYFSGSSKVGFSENSDIGVIRKEFIIDRVQRRKLIKLRVQNSILRKVWKYFDELYQSHRRLQSVALTDILGKLGVRLEFVETEPVGTVVTTYSIAKERIRVRTDFRSVEKKDLKKIFVLNEQGSEFFRRYAASDGTMLVDKEIGAWRKVESQSACITDLRGNLGFELQRKKNGVLRRGRESIPGLADWVGLDYEVDPRNAFFDYEIRILGG